MQKHKPFDFKSSADLLVAAENLGLEIPFREDVSNLFEKVTIGHISVPNRFAVLPMEAADALPNGVPSELTVRRYSRYAQGGSGLIWFEANAVVPEGKSNTRQLMINSDTLPAFRTLVEKTRQSARKAFGSDHNILCVLQLTHSGRYSQPRGQPQPQIAYFNPFLDTKPEEVRFIPDEELDRLQEDFIEAARLAHFAGFDAVDIKSCHGNLLNELLAGYNRKHSKYGMNFENRSRFLTEVAQKIHALVPRILISVRLNAFDGIPFPYGFGFAKDSPLDVDLIELQTLIRRLLIMGCSFFNITAGNPYYKPHLGRPFDRPVSSDLLPDEHPLEGIARLLKMTAGLQKLFPDLPFVGTGYSWLRQYFPNVGAAVVEKKDVEIIGVGRNAFAYPDAPKDLKEKGSLDPEKVCITCSKCSELLRGGHTAGCVVHDKQIYEKEYQKLLSSKH